MSAIDKETSSAASQEFVSSIFGKPSPLDGLKNVHVDGVRRFSGPNARPSRKPKRNYLLKPAYRTLGLPDINNMSDQDLEGKRPVNPP